MKTKKPSLIKCAYRVKKQGSYYAAEGTIALFSEYDSKDFTMHFSCQSDIGNGDSCFYALHFGSLPEFGTPEHVQALAFLQTLAKAFPKQEAPIACVTKNGVPYIGHCSLLKLLKALKALKAEIRVFDEAATFNDMWDFYSYRNIKPKPVEALTAS